MSYSYFIHEWILDPPRVTLLYSIYAELFPICDRLGVRFVSLKGETPEGFTCLKFLIGVSSRSALEEFSTTIARWGFVGWTPLPNDDPVVSSFTDAHWNTIAYHMNPENSSFTPVPNGFLADAYSNERRRENQTTSQ
jgi:hypothetical protein